MFSYERYQKLHEDNGVKLQCYLGTIVGTLVNDGYSESGKRVIPRSSTTPPLKAKHFCYEDSTRFFVMSTVLDASQCYGKF